MIALYEQINRDADTNASQARSRGFAVILQTIFPANEIVRRRRFYRLIAPFIVNLILMFPQEFPTASVARLRRRQGQQRSSLSRLQVSLLISAELFGLHPTHIFEEKRCKLLQRGKLQRIIL